MLAFEGDILLFVFGQFAAEPGRKPPKHIVKFRRMLGVLPWVKGSIAQDAGGAG